MWFFDCPFMIAPSEEHVLNCCTLKTSCLSSTCASNSTLSLLPLHSQIYKRTHRHDAHVLALAPSKDAWPPSLLLEWLQSQLQGPMNGLDRIWSLPVSVRMDPALETHSSSDFPKACLLIPLLPPPRVESGFLTVLPAVPSSPSASPLLTNLSPESTHSIGSVVPWKFQNIYVTAHWMPPPAALDTSSNLSP